MHPVKRRIVTAVTLTVLFLLSLTCTEGALFPWSPVRPGYASAATPRVTLIFPKQSGRPAPLHDVEGTLAEVERTNRLAFRAPVTIVVTDDWGLFNRGTLMGLGSDPVPVLGAALQTGTVVYLSPLAADPARDIQAVLRHELTHALLFQQMPLWRTFGLVKLDWFEEGLAVYAGNRGDYLDDAEWKRWAAGARYRFGPMGDPRLTHVPEPLRGKFRLSEYRIFIEFLKDRYGDERFFRWRDRVLQDPAGHDRAFRASFGQGFAGIAATFEGVVRAAEWPRSR